MDWMEVLIKELFNSYQRVNKDIPWGRVNGLHRKYWSEFNESSLVFAQKSIEEKLPKDDHMRVGMLVKKLSAHHTQEEKY
ncbi:hypothetical protein ACQKNX_00605 [Lysinibacillus sp. NPDC093712]|uniref:hypothetical protein n=1 Tax=Lysinibacillus sp. NPDC093712 TaxID=3390579 RepID=UPI003CFBC4FA